MKKYLFILILALSVVLAGCKSGPLKFEPPDSLIYSKHSKVSKLTVGIYIPKKMKTKKFTPCEKLMFGGIQCYTGDIGKVLQKNVIAAYKRGFRKVVLLKSRKKVRGVDVAVQIEYASEKLKTRLDGIMAYRTVTINIKQRILYSKRRIRFRSKIFRGVTKCKAWKCRVEGVDKGMSGGVVVLKSLFLPGFLLSDYGKGLANIVNTAFCASLKIALESSVYNLKKAVR